MEQTQLKPRKVDFKFGEYISQGIDLMKKDFGTIFLAFIFAMIMGIIPFCGMMAIGNFYKVCYKLDKGIPVKADEVFNFDDFMPYFMFQIFIILGFIVAFIPMGILMFIFNNNETTSGILVVVYMLAFYFLMFYLLLQAFYIPALITFKKITDVKAAWNISKVMTKGNLWTLFFFSIATVFLGELGILLCGIGILITIPFVYVSHYFAFKDGLTQIEFDDITEIGQKI
jgi:hypothetical protein